MSWRRDATGETLLANVPEELPSQYAATSMELGSANLQAQPQTPNRHRRRVVHAGGRVVLRLSLHLVGLVANLAVIYIFLTVNQFIFSSILVLLWMNNAIVCTWVAHKDPDITLLAGLGLARLPFLFLIYGVLQYIQIKHIVDAYKRSAGNAERVTARSEFHAKTFDGIISGIPFAVLCLWAYFQDPDMKQCPWNSSVEFEEWHLIVFMYAAWENIVSVSMGLLELDYRVSTSVSDAIDGSLKETFFQWSYRFTEAGSRIFGAVFICVALEPIAARLSGNSMPMAWLLLCSYPLVWVIVFFVILAFSNARVAKKDHVLAHLIVASITWFVNPFRFVDSPGFIKAALHINRALLVCRVLEFAVLLSSLALFWSVKFPSICDPNPLDHQPSVKPSDMKVLAHVLQKDKPLLEMLVLMLFLHAAVCTLMRFRSTKPSASGGLLTEETVLEIIPVLADCEAAVAVRPTVARGISSQILRVGTGITGELFNEEEQDFGDFIIERVLGRGAYGVVVLVRMRNKGRNSSVDIVYAMKLQNTDARKSKGVSTSVLPSRETTADREREIMLKLQHPFIIRLAYFFEVPDRAFKDASSGDVIKDSNNNSRFHKAIVMEFCPGGDLDDYVCKKAFPQNYKPGTAQYKMDASAAEWLQLGRRLSAEMCVALAFLHDKDIVYRDLKPQNMLLKSGPDSQVHICFTDFGFSKDVGGTESAAGRLDSLAGSPLFAAPEITAIAAHQMRAKYTPAVDLFSLGRTICLMLWRTKIIDDPPELKMPSLADCRTDVRVHKTALALMVQLTSSAPSARGKAADLEAQAFFQEISLENGQVLPALRWADLVSNAS